MQRTQKARELAARFAALIGEDRLDAERRIIRAVCRIAQSDPDTAWGRCRWCGDGVPVHRVVEFDICLICGGVTP